MLRVFDTYITIFEEKINEAGLGPEVLKDFLAWSNYVHDRFARIVLRLKETKLETITSEEVRFLMNMCIKTYNDFEYQWKIVYQEGQNIEMKNIRPTIPDDIRIIIILY